MAQMRELYEKVGARVGEAALTPSVVSRRRSLEFDAICFDLIRDNVEVFREYRNQQLARNCRLHRLKLDAAFVENGYFTCGFLFVAAGGSTAARDTTPILGRLALARQLIGKMWVILPESAQYMGETIKEEAEEWGLQMIEVAIAVESGDVPHLRILDN